MFWAWVIPQINKNKNKVNNKNNKGKNKNNKNDAGENKNKSNLRKYNTDRHSDNIRILELYHQGKNDEEISEELGISIGKVRIVIDLYKDKDISNDK